MCVCVSLVKDRVFEETSSREFVVCAYAKIQCAPTPVCEGALLSVFVCDCVCVCSATLPDGCYLCKSDGQGGCRGTPNVWSAILSQKFDPPRGNLSCCSTFLIPIWGVEWKGICPYLLSASQYTQTLVKVTKKLVFRLAAFFFPSPVSLIFSFSQHPSLGRSFRVGFFFPTKWLNKRW